MNTLKTRHNQNKFNRERKHTITNIIACVVLALAIITTIAGISMHRVHKHCMDSISAIIAIEAPETLQPPQRDQFTTDYYHELAQQKYDKHGTWAYITPRDFCKY